MQLYKLLVCHSKDKDTNKRVKRYQACPKYFSQRVKVYSSYLKDMNKASIPPVSTRYIILFVCNIRFLPSFAPCFWH